MIIKDITGIFSYTNDLDLEEKRMHNMIGGERHSNNLLIKFWSWILSLRRAESAPAMPTQSEVIEPNPSLITCHIAILDHPRHWCNSLLRTQPACKPQNFTQTSTSFAARHAFRFSRTTLLSAAFTDSLSLCVLF